MSDTLYVPNSCHLNTQEVEAGGLQVQSQPGKPVRERNQREKRGLEYDICPQLTVCPEH